QDRALRRRSQLGPERAGRRDGVGGDGAARGRCRDRGRPGVLPRRTRAPRPPRAQRSGPAGRGGVRDRPAGGRCGDGALLFRSRARVHNPKRRLHHVVEARRPMRDVATLLEALPYIREFHGRTVVIKYGGAAMADPALKEEFARDVVLLKYVGMNPVVVHGGGPEITTYMERLELPVRFVHGLRVSDLETVEVARMV